MATSRVRHITLRTTALLLQSMKQKPRQWRDQEKKEKRCRLAVERVEVGDVADIPENEHEHPSEDHSGTERKAPSPEEHEPDRCQEQQRVRHPDEPDVEDPSFPSDP